MDRINQSTRGNPGLSLVSFRNLNLWYWKNNRAGMTLYVHATNVSSIPSTLCVPTESLQKWSLSTDREISPEYMVGVSYTKYKSKQSPNLIRQSLLLSSHKLNILLHSENNDMIFVTCEFLDKGSWKMQQVLYQPGFCLIHIFFPFSHPVSAYESQGCGYWLTKVLCMQTSGIPKILR